MKKLQQKKERKERSRSTDKLFVVRKYIWATSVQQAIHKEQKAPVDDCWVDDKWKENSQVVKDAIGFYAPPDNEY